RFGSKADIGVPPIGVCFTPKSGHWLCGLKCSDVDRHQRQFLVECRLGETVRFKVAGMIRARCGIALIFGLPTRRTVRTTILFEQYATNAIWAGALATSRRERERPAKPGAVTKGERTVADFLSGDYAIDDVTSASVQIALVLRRHRQQSRLGLL